MHLAEAFNPRRNSLDVWRLLLALEVMLYHSFAITGSLPPARLLPLVFGVGVDGFFAISGFLITRSWCNRPKTRDYLAARGLRILPGLWVCLIVTAVGLAPLGVWLQGGSVRDVWASFGPIRYVLNNSLLVFLQPDINGTPADAHFAGVWNASLWSLTFEAACYLGVLALGVLGLLRFRWVSLVLLALGIVLALSLPPLAVPGTWTLAQLGARTIIMFAAGGALYQWRTVIPANWWLVAACAAAVVVAGLLLPDYRVVAGLPLAYAVVVSGALLRGPTLKSDLSYGIYIYAFPVQQVLAMSGLASLPPVVFLGITAVCTLPLAAASWSLIERRALRLKARIVNHIGNRSRAADPVTTPEVVPVRQPARRR